MGKKLEHDDFNSRAQSRKKDIFSKILKVLDLIRSIKNLDQPERILGILTVGSLFRGTQSGNICLYLHPR